jgi:hypothetical protein
LQVRTLGRVLGVPFEQRRADRGAVGARNGFQDELKARASGPLEHLHAAGCAGRSEYGPVRSGEGKGHNHRPAGRRGRGGWRCRHQEEQSGEVSGADRPISIGVRRTIIDSTVVTIIEKPTCKVGELFAAHTTLRRRSQGGTGHNTEAQDNRQPDQAFWKTRAPHTTYKQVAPLCRYTR